MDMKNKIRNISFLVTFISLVSCESFLDKEPLGQLTEGIFLESEEDAILATNAVYNMLRDWHLNGG